MFKDWNNDLSDEETEELHAKLDFIRQADPAVYEQLTFQMFTPYDSALLEQVHEYESENGELILGDII